MKGQGGKAQSSSLTKNEKGCQGCCHRVSNWTIRTPAMLAIKYDKFSRAVHNIYGAHGVRRPNWVLVCVTKLAYEIKLVHFHDRNKNLVVSLK
jgi:hypothetical protein